ncbi:MAG: hypothetical protein KatS3mg010_0579 [Acidimicrobiia bacterium]|nr:MAG: hypothetical protein KatS3mg010_0579 [Acidimicrobiia bacterium]
MRCARGRSCAAPSPSIGEQHPCSGAPALAVARSSLVPSAWRCSLSAPRARGARTALSRAADAIARMPAPPEPSPRTRLRRPARRARSHRRPRAPDRSAPSGASSSPYRTRTSCASSPPGCEPLERSWLARLVAALDGGAVAAAPLLLHPRRRWAQATPHDGRIRARGVDAVIGRRRRPRAARRRSGTPGRRRRRSDRGVPRRRVPRGDARRVRLRRRPAFARRPRPRSRRPLPAPATRRRLRSSWCRRRRWSTGARYGSARRSTRRSPTGPTRAAVSSRCTGRRSSGAPLPPATACCASR